VEHITTAADVVKETQWLSERVSTQVRALSAGLLALVWALILKPLPGLDMAAIVIAALLAVLTLFLDLAQLAIGYVATKRHLEAMTRDEAPILDYDPTARPYRYRQYLFWAKQATVAAAAVMFAIGLWSAIPTKG
jgi:hypothetical protein